MIELFIFHLHIIAALYVFTKNWQNDSIKDGIMAVLILALVFIIGWALTGPLANLLMPNSFKSPFFTKDTLSLVLLLIPESFFFYYFFITDKKTIEEKTKR